MNDAIAIRWLPMVIRRAFLLRVLFCVIVFSHLAQAQCKKAKADDVPHGANEFILLNGGTLGRIHGTVFLPNSIRAEDVVVEVYTYSGRNEYATVKKVLSEQKRVAACITGSDGRFSFPRLKPGRYLLRAGTRKNDQYNQIHAILVLTLNRGAGRGVKIVLSPGT
jgi:hypothetical protein